jgi:hypothetical protein
MLLQRLAMTYDPMVLVTLSSSHLYASLSSQLGLVANLVHLHGWNVRGGRRCIKRRSWIEALVHVTPAVLAPLSSRNSLWQICGRNKGKATGKGWDGCQQLQKSLIFARGCNSIQNQ